MGPADAGAIAEAARLIDAAERPVVLLGMLASQPAAADAVRALLVQMQAGRRRHLPGGRRRAARACSTASAAASACSTTSRPTGCSTPPTWSLTVGFDPVEYDPALWNAGRTRKLIHVDCVPADPDRHYRPDLELLGDIAATLCGAGAAAEEPAASRPGRPAGRDRRRQDPRGGRGGRACRHAGPSAAARPRAAGGCSTRTPRCAPTWARSTSGWPAICSPTGRARS